MSSGDVASANRESSVVGSAPSRGRTFRNQVASWMRWLHIYLSLFGLSAILFFSLTGITLNHPGWAFGSAERTTQGEGEVDLKWLGGSVAKLEVVELLRARHGVRGALAEFRADDRECMVSFKGPGYSADAFIDRETGRYTITQTFHGLLAVINDLHKGRDTGPVWSAVIDASALVMTAVSLTGLVLLFYLKRRRLTGVLTGLVGTAVVVAFYWFWVP